MTTQGTLLHPPVNIPKGCVVFSRKSHFSGAHYEFTVKNADGNKIEIISAKRNGQPVKTMKGLVNPFMLKVTKDALGFK